MHKYKLIEEDKDKFDIDQIFKDFGFELVSNLNYKKQNNYDEE